MKSLRIEFLNDRGIKLAARMEIPDREPLAHALFVHGFVLGKDSLAASRTSRALAARGIATLRFDFTGLGGSDGDFSDTNFSTNMQDIVSAARWLGENHKAPDLLVGHSLGGAASLATARDIPSLAAVAVVGAPSDPAHVTEHFADRFEEIAKSGVAEISLGGRPFQIQQQFIDDIRSQCNFERINSLGKALLVMHSPVDQTVGIENAAMIYEAAKHPKSFISLDSADHLLMRREDADYVAEALAAWATRYLGIAAAGHGSAMAANTAPASGDAAVAPEVAATPALAAGEVRVTETGLNPFQNRIQADGHVLMADEPAAIGGGDTGPTPYGYLLSGLGACTAMTIRMVANRRKWPLTKVNVTLRHDRVHGEDCEAVDQKVCQLEVLEKRVQLEGDLTPEQRQSLLEIGEKCPVHRTLTGKMEIRSVLVD